MNKEDLVQLISNSDDETVTQFLDKSDTNVKVQTKYQSVQFDYSWIEKIEETIPYLDNLVRNPRKFIVQEEEVVPVERAKKISQETIKHLAQHTNLIQDVDEDGTITPSKVLNVHKEESFDIYENRFLISLLKNLSFFFQMRKEATKQGSFSKSDKNLSFTGTTDIGSEQVKIDVNLESKTFDDLAGENASGAGLNERIEHIEHIISDFLKSPFAKDLVNALPVRSPIRKTNAILKNTNLQKALALWEFIEGYDVKDKREVNDENSVENNKDLKEKMDMSFYLNYAILNSFNGENKEKQEDVLNTFAIKKLISNFIEYNKEITEKEFKKMISDEFALVKERQLKLEKEIYKLFVIEIKKSENNKKKSLQILKY